MRQFGRLAAAYLRIVEAEIIIYAAILITAQGRWDGEHGRRDFGEASAVLTNRFTLEPRKHRRPLALNERDCGEQGRA